MKWVSKEASEDLASTSLKSKNMENPTMNNFTLINSDKSLYFGIESQCFKETVNKKVLIWYFLKFLSIKFVWPICVCRHPYLTIPIGRTTKTKQAPSGYIDKNKMKGVHIPIVTAPPKYVLCCRK